MSEPLRSAEQASASSSGDLDRHARIEQLLLSGLDHYFAGQYEQAINIWTRVGFLERGHGRARAYIERARSALAERQRASEELVHGGVAAFNAGDFASARTLLTRAVDEGGPTDTALMFLERLGRFESAVAEMRGGRIPATSADPAQTPTKPTTNWPITIAVSVSIAAAFVLFAMPLASWLANRPLDAPITAPAPPEPLPLVRAAEMTFTQAQALYDGGHLRDALRLLEDIEVGDPLRDDADRLRADIQRNLLRFAADPSARPLDVPIKR